MNLIEKIEELALIGKTPNGICREAGSKEDNLGKSLCISYMMYAGMTVRRDEWGNIIGRLDGIGAPIVTGSHTDTVPMQVSMMVLWGSQQVSRSRNTKRSTSQPFGGCDFS